MIDRNDLSLLAKSVSVVVREMVAGLRASVDKLEQRLNEIPAGPKGEPGERGESIKGDVGPAGKDGESIIGPVGPAGERGPAGEPGVSIKGDAGQRGLDGKDAEPIRPDTVELMVRREVEKAIASIAKPKDGRDGDPGRDALQIEILPAVDSAKSFPRGTYALYEGGEIRATRQTSPLVDGFEKSGWEVVKNGIAAVMVTQGDDLRSFSFHVRHTGGQENVSTFCIPAVLDRGVWDEKEFARGDGVTYSGSFWICQVDKTKAKPGMSSDWRLSIKRGSEGKPGTNGKDGERGPEGKAGRDLTQMDYGGNKH